MTKIFLISDLHNERLRFQMPEDLDYDVLVAAGDIDDNPERAVEFLASVGKPVVWVAGNHDLWSQPAKRGQPYVDFSTRLGHLKRLCEGTQVHLLEQESVVIDGTRFVGTMLWTSYLHGNKQLMHYGLSTMNDFNSIGATAWLRDPRNREAFLRDCQRYGFDRHTAERIDWNCVMFHPVLAYAWHQESKHWLEAELREEGDWQTTVVVTHHAPTYLSLTRTGYVAEKNLDPKSWSSRLDIRWDNDNIYRIGSYASPDDDLLARHQDKISLWIHGHIHRSVDVSAGGVRVVCNPRGYAYNKDSVQSGDNRNFDPRLVIDLDRQGGYMPLLKAEIDEAVVELENILDEIQAIGAHRKHADPSLRTAAREAFNKRVEAFSEEGHKICKRVNENVQKRGFLPNRNDLQFPLKAFCVSPELSIDNYSSQPRRRTDRALSSIVRDAKGFIAVLQRIPNLPAAMEKEAGRQARLVIGALQKEAVAAEFVPVDKKHVDIELQFRVVGQHSKERQQELSHLADSVVNPHVPRKWFVSLQFEAVDKGQREEPEQVATGGRVSGDVVTVESMEQSFVLQYPVVTFAKPAEIFYQLDRKWKCVTVRMEESHATSAMFSHALLVRAVLQIEKENEIQIVLDDTGQRYRIHGQDDPHHRLVFVFGKVEYRASLIRQQTGDVVVEMEPG